MTSVVAWNQTMCIKCLISVPGWGQHPEGKTALAGTQQTEGENRELLAVKAELEYLVGHSGHWHRTRWTGCMGRCIPTCPAFPQTLTTKNPNYPQKVPIQREGDPAGLLVTQVYGRAQQNTSIVVINLLWSSVESLEHEQCELSSSHYKLHMELELTL